MTVASLGDPVERPDTSHSPGRGHAGRHSATKLWMAGTLLIVFLFFLPNPTDLNARAHLDTTIALVEHGTFAIDQYAWNTGDLAYSGGHWFSNKYPGQSLAAVPILFAMKATLALVGKERDLDGIGTRQSVNSGLMPYYLLMFFTVLFTVTLPAVFTLMIFFWLLQAFSDSFRNRVVLTLALGLATEFLPYSHNVYSHVPTAALQLSGFALVFALQRPAADALVLPGRLAAHPRLACGLAGLLLGLGVLFEYQAVVPLCLIGIYALWCLPRRLFMPLLAGALVGPGAVLVCARMAYGSFTATGYTQHNYYAPLQNRGIGGFAWPPAANALWGLTVSPYRGIFFLSPFLLLSVPGAWMMGRRFLREAAAVCGIPCVLVPTMAMFAYWNGGGDAVGPRLLVVCLPFAALPAVFVMDRLTHPLARVGMYFVFGASAVITWIETLGYTGSPPYTHDPLPDSSVPALAHGDVALNWGSLLLAPVGGLHSLWSLAFLPLALAVWSLRIYRRLKRADDETGVPGCSLSTDAKA